MVHSCDIIPGAAFYSSFVFCELLRPSLSWLSTIISHNIKLLTGEVNNIDNLVTGIVPLGNMFQAFMWKPLDTHAPLEHHCRTCTPPLPHGAAVRWTSSRLSHGCSIRLGSCKCGSQVDIVSSLSRFSGLS